MLFLLLVFSLVLFQVSLGATNLTWKLVGQDARVIGGVDAKKDDWQFIAAVGAGQVVHCGGTLIRPRWVLTAGQCVKGHHPMVQTHYFGYFAVSIGPEELMYDSIKPYLKRPLDVDVDVDGIVVSVIHNTLYMYNVEKFFVHPDYIHEDIKKDNGRTLELVGNDVALLRLDSKVEGVVPVNLPIDRIDAKARCRAAGWGSTITLANEKNEKYSLNILQELDLDVLVDIKCQHIFDDILTIAKISENAHYHYQKKKKYCALGIPNDGRYVDIGDSGGPLICDNELQGVASQLMPARVNYETKLASIFMDVAYYIDWISGIFVENGESPIPANIYRKEDYNNQNINENRKHLIIITLIFINYMYLMV